MRLDRSIYKKIKKMNREEMEGYLERLYKFAFQDGTEVSNHTDFKIKLSEVLNNTKGIGPKLYDKIMENIK